jgi:predicted nuclease of predicted toxin-antitoxin system
VNVLLDSCVSALTVAVLRQAGHDVIWAGDWPADPGDAQILRLASADSPVLATIAN